MLQRLFQASPPDQIEAVFARQRASDPFGLRVHEICGVLSCLMAGGPTSIAEWALAPVLFCFIIRYTNAANRPVTRPMLRDPVVRLIAAFIASVFASILWSACRTPIDGAIAGADKRDWLHDVQSFRFALMLPLLYPVLERRSWLIVALMVGFFAGQCSQIMHLIGETFHIASLSFHRMPGRLSGWWDPVVGGSVLCGVLGLHLGLASSGLTLRARIIGATLGCFTIACILATGTRGAWIGAGLLVLFVLARSAITLVRRGDTDVARGAPALALAALVVLIGGASAWLFTGKGIMQRFEQGQHEIERTLTAGEYSSDTGMRLAMWRWAGIEWAHQPLVGVGAGGFRAYADQQLAKQSLTHEPEFLPPRPHAHAHSWYLHTLATTGIVGCVLLFSGVTLAVRSGLREAGLGLGPALGLVGLACAGLFDPIHINQQTALMLWTLVALCVPSRPRELDLQEPAQ